MTTTRLPRPLTDKHHDLMRERVQLVARVEEVDRELASLEYAIRVLDPWPFSLLRKSRDKPNKGMTACSQR